MKQIRTSFNTIGVIALLALTAGCATTASFPQEKANMLVAAGFKTVTPKTAAQQQKLQQLQTGQVATIQKKRENLLHCRGPASEPGLCGWTARIPGLSTTPRSKAACTREPPNCRDVSGRSNAVGCMGWLGSLAGDQWEWGSVGSVGFKGARLLKFHESPFTSTSFSKSKTK